MSIRFKCTACQTVLKIGEAISEPKKVRCTGCGIVIVLTPDEDEPTGMTVSVPQQSGEHKGMSKEERARQRVILLSVGGVAGLLLLLGLWWLLSGPSDRGAVEGKVMLDGKEMEKGTIYFISADPKKGGLINAPIEQGRYSIRASKGPFVGMNKVEIRSDRGTGKQIPKPGSAGEMIEQTIEAVAARYNSKSELKWEIQRGSNSKDFEVKSQ